MAAFEDDDDDFPTTTEGFAALRKAYRKAQRELSTKNEELTVYKQKESRGTVESALSAKGLNPLLADFYKESDTSEAAVAAWAEKYAPLFGGAAAPHDKAPPAAPEGEALPPEVAERQALAKRLQGTFDAAMSPAAGGSAEAALQAVNSANSVEEVLRALGR